MFTRRWKLSFQLTCSFHWGSTSTSLPSWTRVHQPRAQDRAGGDWEPSDDSIARFEPSGLFLFWFGVKGFGLATKSLFGNLVLNEVQRVAVISPATRFSAPALTVGATTRIRALRCLSLNCLTPALCLTVLGIGTGVRTRTPHLSI
jgi:hypothetical protein